MNLGVFADAAGQPLEWRIVGLHPVGWQTGMAGLVGGPAGVTVLAGAGSAKCAGVAVIAGAESVKCVEIAEAGLAEFAEVTADCRRVAELHSTKAVTIALG